MKGTRKQTWAQRKFAQGCQPPVAVASTSNTTREEPTVPTAKAATKTVIHNMIAPAFVNYLSFRRIHEHDMPVVILERLDVTIDDSNEDDTPLTYFKRKQNKKNKIASDESNGTKAPVDAQVKNKTLKSIKTTPVDRSSMKRKCTERNYKRYNRSESPPAKPKRKRKPEGSKDKGSKPCTSESLPDKQKPKVGKKLDNSVIGTNGTTRISKEPDTNNVGNLELQPEPKSNQSLTKGKKTKKKKRTTRLSKSLKGSTEHEETAESDSNNVGNLELQPEPEPEPEPEPTLNKSPTKGKKTKNIETTSPLKESLKKSTEHEETVAPSPKMDDVIVVIDDDNDLEKHNYYDTDTIEQWIESDVLSNKSQMEPLVYSDEEPEGGAEVEPLVDWCIPKCPSQKLKTVRQVISASQGDLHQMCKSCIPCGRVDKVLKLITLVRTPGDSSDVYNFEDVEESVQSHRFRSRRAAAIDPDSNNLYLDLLARNSPQIVKITFADAPNCKKQILRAGLVPRAEAIDSDLYLDDSEHLVDQLLSTLAINEPPPLPLQPHKSRFPRQPLPHSPIPLTSAGVGLHCAQTIEDGGELSSTESMGSDAKDRMVWDLVEAEETIVSGLNVNQTPNVTKDGERLPEMPSTSAGMLSTSSGMPSTSAEMPTASAEMPSTSWGMPSTSWGMPSTSWGMPSTSWGMPSTSWGMPSTLSRKPSTSAGMLSTSAGMPSTSAGMPSTSAQKPLTSAGMPSTSAGMPSTSAGMPSSSAGMPSASAGIRSTSAGMPSTSMGMPLTSAGMPSTSAGMPSTSAGMPSTSAGMPSTSAGMPSTSAGMPSTSAGMPSTSAGMPSTSAQKPSTSAEMPSTSAQAEPEPEREQPPTTGFVDAPTFYPTIEEFKDPIAYFEKVMKLAQDYAICKIVPPKGFKPKCNLSQIGKFHVTNQYIVRLFRRWGPALKCMCAIRAYLSSQSVIFSRSPLCEGLEVNLPKLYNLVQQQGGLRRVIEKKRWGRVADQMNFVKLTRPEKKLDQLYVKYLLPYDTMSKRERQRIHSLVQQCWEEKSQKILARAVSPLHRQRKVLNGEDSSATESSADEDEKTARVVWSLVEAEDCVVSGRAMQLSTFRKIARGMLFSYFPGPEVPTPEEVEETYWRLVTEGTDYVCAYSASIDTGNAGFGFHIKPHLDSMARHPWNLKMISKNKANMLRFMGPVVGLTTPTLHLGMLFSTSCWHRDPHGLPWVEYQHSGPTKIWYGISEGQSAAFRRAVEHLCPTFCQNKTVWLPSDITMIPPELLVEHGIKLTKIEQKPREFVLVLPKAYSSSICTGYTESESVYFATGAWFDGVNDVFSELRATCEPTMFALEHLLIRACSSGQLDKERKKRVAAWLQQLLNQELTSRRALASAGVKVLSSPFYHQRSRAWDQSECEICRGSLYLSAVYGIVDARRSCPTHALQLLSLPKHQAGIRNVKLRVKIPDRELHRLLSNAETILNNS